MKYRLRRRANPQDRTDVRWYAVPVNEGRVTKDELVREITAISSVSRGDVLSVIENLSDIVPKYLTQGRSVSLGGLVTMRISFGSEGVVSADDFTVSRISNSKIVFTAAVELKRQLRGIRYEPETKYKP